MRFCQWRKRCQAAADIDDALPSPNSSPEVDSWRKVRFSYIRLLRRNTKFIILLMAMMEALKHGPLELAYAGRSGYPAPNPQEDYGFAYTAGCILSYVYVCIFMVVFVPLFSWWIPKDTPDENGNMPKHTKTECLAKWLKKINMALVPFSIGFSLASYLITLIQVFIYVDARPVASMRMPKNTRKNWCARLLLIAGVMIVFGLITGVALPTLEYVELARVKRVEYFVILCPIQINLGVLLGTRLQRRMEKKLARIEKLVKIEPAEKVDEVAKAEDEKKPLLVEV